MTVQFATEDPFFHECLKEIHKDKTIKNLFDSGLFAHAAIALADKLEISYFDARVVTDFLVDGALGGSAFTWSYPRGMSFIEKPQIFTPGQLIEHLQARV